MNNKLVVFNTLRVALIFAIVLSNLSALIAFSYPHAHWSKPLGIYSVVFILLFVFVILLEIVWILNMRKVQTDRLIRKKYSLALIIYGFFFVLGFFIVYRVLLG